MLLNIEILGLDVISRGTVLSYLPVEAGDDYTDQMSKETQHSLFTKIHFYLVQLNI
jgi:outer membrane protein insertion porin family